MSYSQVQPERMQSRLDSLTGLRFVAALFVFFFHASLTKIIGFNPYADETVVSVFQRLFSVGGWVGVSFFFVLSGFVVTWSARPGDPATAFWRRRIVKIYPNHAVTWLLALLVFSGPVTALSAAIPNLLLIHSWIPDINIFLGMNGPSWSLCCELFFYLSFPFLFRLVERISPSKLWFWAVAMVAGLALTQIAVAHFVPGEPQIAEYPISLEQWWVAYFLPPLRLFEFVLGMLMARILKAGLWPHIPMAVASAIMLGGYIAAGLVPFQFSLNLATIAPIAILITALADRDTLGESSIFAGRTFVKLGEISFGFYMIHLIVMTAVTILLAGQHFTFFTATVIVATTLLASILAGWCLFTFVEQPAMKRWSRPAAIRREVQAT